MENKADKVHICRQRIQFVRQPLTLRSGSFVERTVKHQQERVGGTGGVVTIILQIRETLEVVRERDLLIAVKIMISQCRINRYFVFAPDSSFFVPDLPVIHIVALVGNIAADGDEGGMSIRN